MAQKKTNLPATRANDLDRQEVVALVRRAEKGDRAALLALRQMYDAAPALWRGIGDRASTAERAILQAASGDNLAFREACERTAAALRANLAGPDRTPLERLLVDRIVACWLALHYAETIYHQNMGELSRGWADFHQRRIDRAHHRYLTAIKTLAQVRRLLPPAVQVNIAEQQVNLVQ